MFRHSWLPEAFARVFSPPPDVPIWQWAETNVWLENKDAAEPGFYRSSKTPWTRRVQDVIRKPVMFVPDPQSPCGWSLVKVHEFNAKKSSQSGFSEAVLNGVRWLAKYMPRNVIYQIDTREQAKNIVDRLLPSLQKIGGNIFTGDDDDLGALILKLRLMTVWFIGSFSSSGAANKQAPFVVNDELEEHGQAKGDTSARRNLKSRTKTSSAGLEFNLSKPKKSTGPICKAHRRGNQEEFMFPCPHCGKWQWASMFKNNDDEERETPFDLEQLEWVEIDGQRDLLPRVLPIGETRKVKLGRLVWEHCIDELGRIDRLRVLRETFYECAHCAGRIDEWRKGELTEQAQWVPTSLGTPGIISQHCSDLLSLDEQSSWGSIVLEYLDAKAEGRTELQGFYNHRLGLGFKDEANRTSESDLKANIARGGETGCPAYRRGELPFKPATILFGADVQLAFCRWSIGAVHENLRDLAIINWGTELTPGDLAKVFMEVRFSFAEKLYRCARGRVDAKYRKDDVYKACLATGGMLQPSAGLGGMAARARSSLDENKIPNMRGLRLLTYKDEDAKNELFITGLKKQERHIWLPIETMEDKTFVDEMCCERREPDHNGNLKWNEHPGPNHTPDTIKVMLNELRWLTRRATETATASKAEE